MSQGISSVGRTPIQTHRDSGGLPGLGIVVPRLILAAFLGLVPLGCGADSAPTPGEESPRGVVSQADREDILRGDERIAKLLQTCPEKSLYNVEIGQSSVLIERLVDKLEHGQLEVLKRAKDELAQIGAPAIPLLRRLIERSYANAFHSAYIENALGAASIMRDPAARELLFLGFDHPQESVRLVAVTGLRLFHALPEDFDRIKLRLEAPEGSLMRQGLAEALFRADRRRAEELVLSWLEEGREQSLWLDTVKELCLTQEDAVRARCAALFAQQEDARLAEWLAAAGAAGGDMTCRQWVGERLREGPWTQRLSLTEAVAQAGWVEPLLDVALDDPNSNVVLVAADHLAEAPGWNRERRDVLFALLDSPTADVRSQMLKRLVEKGDIESIDRAIAQLQADTAEPLQAALLALQGPMQGDRELAERVAAALEERNRRELDAPLGERRRTIKAIGIVPLAWSADTLLDIARAHPGERLEGLRAHEWILVHAGNSGDAGRARLFERLPEERDPRRRLDIIRAISNARTDAPRELLLRLAESGADSELELLYIADRLARVGPSHLVAPRLKRVLYAMQTEEARRALSCLLWYWY